MLRVGSTFSGVGGADLGLERAGFDVAWLCEWDEWKRSVLAAHWPSVTLYGDIRDVDNPEPVDLLCGGFPCQDLSVAGKRRGFDGERSVLAFEFLRIAESVRPRWLLMENVPGLLSSNGGRDLARLLDELGAIGYGWAYRVLDARYFGVPQRRRRVFIVARRADAELDTRAAAGLALRAVWEGSGGDSTPGWPPREIAPTRAGAGAEVGSGIAGSLTKRYGKGVNTTCDNGAMIAFRKSARVSGPGTPETWVADGKANTLNAFDVGDVRTTHAIVAHGVSAGDAEVAGTLCTNAQGGQRTTDIAGAYVSQTFPIDDGRPVEKHQNGTGIGDAGAPAYTLDRQQQPAVAHTLTSAGHDASEDGTGRGTPIVPDHMSVRRLTPVECERLMGWPDGWTAPPGVKAPDSKRYAACGDGIVSWVAYWIGCRIRMIEEEAA